MPKHINRESVTNPDRQIPNENPVELFELVWADTFFEYIREQTVQELKAFFPILLISVYIQRPRKYMYWSMDWDLCNEGVANTMSRNRFREILKKLHLINNAELTPNKFAKVRPLIEYLNTVFMKYMLNSATVPIAVDESIVIVCSVVQC